MSFHPIAIVGRGAVLPGALSPGALFDNVFNKTSSIRDVPAERWGVRTDDVFAQSPGKDQTGSIRGGYVEGFDAAYTPAKGDEHLDPLFHWLDHATQEALSEAGTISDAQRARSACIFGNLSFPTRHLAALSEHAFFERFSPEGLSPPPIPSVDPRDRHMSSLPSLYVAKRHGLTGPAFCLDAACASSLYAIRIACDLLAQRRCDIAFSGAVNRADNLFLHLGFTALQALSKSGQSRPFHADADGLLPAEGAGVVALMRLEDAYAQGRQVYGVIRGIGLSNDGRSRNLLAPSSEGQVRAIQNAYQQLDFGPTDVDMVECHATGTALGDGTELESMRRAFGERSVPLRLSSLKSNIGHSITTAGVAGLLKVTGAFERECFPPTLHAQEAPLPALLEKDSPFALIHNAEPWETSGKRRAGVSAFGFGGNNAHLVVEQSDPSESERAKTMVSVLASPKSLSGQTPLAVIGLERSVPGADQKVSTPIEGVRFPPNDLKEALPQQLLVFDAVRTLVGKLKSELSPEKTSILVGLEADLEVTTPGLRWRAPHYARAFSEAEESPLSDEELAEYTQVLKDAVRPPVSAQSVLGQMPNIPANRLSVQLDARGPGFTISAGGHSGAQALQTLTPWLMAREIDVAIVCAVECGDDFRDPNRNEDQAIALAVTLPETARARGDAILAYIDGADSSSFSVRSSDDGEETPEGSGDSESTRDLVQLSQAIENCARLSKAGLPWCTLDARRANVSLTHGGRKSMVRIRSEGRPEEQAPPCRVVAVSAPSREELPDALRVYAKTRHISKVNESSYRVAFVCDEGEASARCVEVAAALERGEQGEDVFIGSGQVRDDALAFVFGGAANPFRGVASELVSAFPEHLYDLTERVPSLHRALSVPSLYGESHAQLSYLEQMLASSAVQQFHSRISRQVLGLKPHAVVGYSLGETNALMAFDVWRDFAKLFDDVTQSGLFDRELAGDCRAYQKFCEDKGHRKNDDMIFVSAAVHAPEERVLAAIEDEPFAFLTLKNTHDDHVLGGDKEALERVAKTLGVPLYFAAAPGVHGPFVGPVKERYKRLHTRETHKPLASHPVQFYSHGIMDSYTPSEERCADTILAQAMTPVDFPALMQKVTRDGFRVFLDHGPRGLCAQYIREMKLPGVHAFGLCGGPQVSALTHAASVSAQLYALGVSVDLSRLAPNPPRGALISVAAHRTFSRLPSPRSINQRPKNESTVNTPTPPPSSLDAAPSPQLMPQAPTLAPLTFARSRERDVRPAPTPAAPAPVPVTPAPAASPTPTREVVVQATPAVSSNEGLMAQAHRIYLEQQARAHSAFLTHQSKMSAQLFGETDSTVPQSFNSIESETLNAQPQPQAPALPLPLPETKAPEETRELFATRAQLEQLASGKISSVWGETFARQDHFTRQVRMPEPPLLLCDRVVSTDAEAGILEAHKTMVTETDVTWDAWYLHEGRIPPGILIEAGQADLLLISYMGVDFDNRGDRVYRLLGCDLTYRGELPKAGDLLHFDIHIDGFAENGDTRLFFFHSDCRVGGPEGEIVLSVRNGQAGFFSDEELADSGGVLWKPEDEGDQSHRPHISTNIESSKNALDRAALEAFAAGDLEGCFGEGFEIAHTHVRTPKIQSGDMLLVDRVTDLDPNAGPYGRGYLRAELDLHEDKWFYKGHFKDDPCMPGTIMFEGCLQTLSIYLASQGLTLDKDAFRFEPLKDTAFPLRCRGQAIPKAREMVYEVFVKELHGGLHPKVVADIVVTVDGLKGLFCHEVGVELVTDFPLSTAPQLLGDTLRLDSVDAVGGVGRDDDDAAFGQRALLATGWGKPSEAFGQMYERFDDTGRVPRLPGPPYHFMSRVRSVTGPGIGVLEAGGTATVEYDVPPDAWYFTQGATDSMPYAVLLEVALQPCGWLSSYVGSALSADEDLYYRNLDGRGRVLREVSNNVGMLTTATTLKKTSSSGGMIIQEFDFVLSDDQGPLFEGWTQFGFFPKGALARQVGTGFSDEDKHWLDRASDHKVDLTQGSGPFFDGPLRLPEPALLMIDRVTGYWKADARHGIARVRTEKDVNLKEWFFKAHFFQDPVQPGSLGIEAMIQALQWYMIERGKGDGFSRPRFQSIATDTPLEWKYRGQVVPANALIQVEIEVLEDHGDTVVAEGFLWADGLRIYHAQKLAMRVIEG